MDPNAQCSNLAEAVALVIAGAEIVAHIDNDQITLSMPADDYATVYQSHPHTMLVELFELIGIPAESV